MPGQHALTGKPGVQPVTVRLAGQYGSGILDACRLA
jgi:hypothetical protein